MHATPHVLPQAALEAQVFLDAIGVPASSERRSGLRGIYDRVTLNGAVPDEAIELLLLDERYERVPLACHTRARSCQPDVHRSHNRKVRSQAMDRM
jgi:hypothetical protein